MNACPELEVIAAYLDGRLTGRERAVVAEHLAECESCYFIFAEAAQMRTSETTRHSTTDTTDVELPVPAAAPKWWTTPKVLWSSAAGLAAAATLVVAVGTGMLPWRAESSELRALVTAVGTDRVIESRLIGGFRYAPLRDVVRGETSSTVSPDIRIAAAELEKATTGATSADRLRERGVAELIVGDVDRAIATITAAAEMNPDDVRTQNDLAAAYLVRGARISQPDDFRKALAAANRAVNTHPTLPEALFNRALALERLAMTDDAREAWQAYLAIDNRTGWADEARTRLRGLTERP